MKQNCIAQLCFNNRSLQREKKSCNSELVGMLFFSQDFLYTYFACTVCFFLQEIFEHMSTLNNDVYFLCGMESFKELIGLIEHIDLPLRVRYQFCMAPVSVKSIFLSTLFTKVFTNQQHISLLFTFDKLMICFHLLLCCYRGTVSCVSHIAHEPLAFCCQR